MAERDPLKDPVITRIAEAHGKTAAQAILRWRFQNGAIGIPKSVHVGRIAENIDFFDFGLSEEEIGRIYGLDTGKRGGPDPTAIPTASPNTTNRSRYPQNKSRMEKVSD